MMRNVKLKYIAEPKLEFSHHQCEEHPKDGLFLYGPVDSTVSGGILRFGLIGTKAGLDVFRNWENIINGYIPPYKEDIAHHAGFPGFEAAFGLRWPDTPIAKVVLPEKAIKETIMRNNRHEAIKSTVDIYADGIIKHLREEGEVSPDFWYVVIPDEVYQYGRPKKAPPKDQRTEGEAKLSVKAAKKLLNAPSLFESENEEADLQRYAVNFHNQLKARLLKVAPIQIIQESTLIEACDIELKIERRKKQDPATIAWNLCTTSYYKSAGPPWRLQDIRKGVCYVGIVFKQDPSSINSNNACCGAQLFLRSGEGLVFKGTTGAWYSKDLKEFHLSKEKAKELMALVVDGYKDINGELPEEIFIHAKSRFNEEEWSGFLESVPKGTKLNGIRIRPNDELKLYRFAKQPPVRGTYYQVYDRMAYLWTKGYVGRYNTYPGFEVPNPISIHIDWGDADLDTVVADILALTKVNFNGCNFSDGLPVTLKFADAIGEILTAAPDIEDGAPQLFKYYI